MSIAGEDRRTPSAIITPPTIRQHGRQNRQVQAGDPAGQCFSISASFGMLELALLQVLWLRVWGGGANQANALLFSLPFLAK